MSFLIAILVVVALSLNAAYIFRRKFEHALPMTIAAVSLLFYVLGLLNIRSIGSYLVLLAVLSSSIFSIHKIIRHKTNPFFVFQSSGLISFLAIILIIGFLASGFVFSTWDEFSHWGLILKNLFQTDGFGNLVGSTTLFTWYPQGVSLFLNYITSFSSHFSESSALAGLLAMSYAQLLLIFMKVKHFDWKKTALITGIIFTLPLVFFSNFLSTIYVDGILALIFANALFFIYSYRKKDIFYAIYLSLQLYLLVNTKQIGLVLSLIIMGVVIGDLVYTYRRNLQKLGQFLASAKHDLIIVLIPLLAIALTHLSWSFYLKFHHISSNFSAPSLKTLSGVFFGSYPEYRDTTVGNFIHYFFDGRHFGPVSFSYFLWSIIILLVLYFVYIRQKRAAPERSFIIQALAVAGCYLYSGVLLVMYLTNFDAYESTNLASIDRYLGTYFLCLLVFTSFIVINYLIRKPLHSNPKIAALFLVILFFVPMGNLISDIVQHRIAVTAKHTMRAPYEDIKRYQEMLDRSKDKVFIISQNSNGLDYFVLRYNITPVASSDEHRAWSLGKQYSSDDQWTKDITADEWSNILKKYTYVYLYNVDDRFISDYGRLFEDKGTITDNSLHKVEQTNASINLVLVNP